MSDVLRRYGLVGAILLAFVGVFVVLMSSARGRDLTRDHSVFRRNRWGCAALAELCARTRPALTVRELTQPLVRLAEVEGLLVILDPEEPFSDEEIAELVRWVKAGGTLFFGMEGLWDDAYSGRSARGPAYVKLAAAFGVAARRTDRPLRRAQPTPASPLGSGVRHVALSTHYTAEALAGQDEASAWAEEEFYTGPVECLAPGRSRDVTVHLAVDGKAVLASLPHGRGRVYFTSDAGLFDNSRLWRDDNVALAANLLWPHAAGGTVWFDEYHHGWGPRAPVAAPVDASPLVRAGLVVAAGCVLLLIGQAVRFGAPVSAFDPRRRTAMEYVQALAGLWRRAEANGPALQQIAAAFRHRLSAAAGLRATASADAAAAALAERRRVPPEKTLALFRDLEAALAAPALGRRELSRLVKRMTALEALAAAPASGERRSAAREAANP